MQAAEAAPVLALPCAADLDGLPFRQIWACDFEFQAPGGERPSVVCMVAKELKTGRTLRLWRDELMALRRPPFQTDTNALFIAYYNSAEIGCFLELGWEPPAVALDLFAEFRALTNGRPTIAGAGLVGALAHFGLETRGAEDKVEMRELIMARASMLWSPAERRRIVDYCEGDVLALERLLPRLLPFIFRHGDASLAHSLFRARYMTAAARMEREGVPIDTALLGRLNAAWDAIRYRLIAEINGAFGVYQDGSFSLARFDAFLSAHGIDWPRTETGLPETRASTFRDMRAVYPVLEPLAEVRSTLSELKLHSLTVGQDARNRCLLSAFRSRSGRNQPSNARFIFGPAKWIRWLIVAPEGQALCYIDWRSQELGIAGGLSGDQRLIDSYLGGDPYMAFARGASMVPADATAETHPTERDVAKAIVLGVNYGMGARALAYRAGIGEAAATSLLRIHRRAYGRFWEWSEMQVDRGMSGAEMLTRLGWPLRVGAADYNTRSLRNHPVQANGADAMRLAACLATEAGHRLCAPVHDAFLLIGDAATIEAEARAVAGIMQRAATLVAKIPIDAEAGPSAFVRPGERYREKRGAKMFARMMRLLREVER